MKFIINIENVQMKITQVRFNKEISMKFIRNSLSSSNKIIKMKFGR